MPMRLSRLLVIYGTRAQQCVAMGEAKRRRAHRVENRLEQSAELSTGPSAPDALAVREPPQGRTKKQHYNPRLHLKRFTNGSGKLYVYDKFTNKMFPAGVDDVGHENHFFTFPELDGDRGAGAHFEGFFGPAEDAAAPVIESILEQVDSGVVSGIVSSDAKRPLARFLALQHLRTKVGRARAIAGRDAMARAVTELEKEGLCLAPDDKELFTGAVDPKTAHAELLLHPTLIDEMTRVLLGHVWYVYANPTGTALYTSDHPLSFRCFDSSPLRGAGPASFGAELSYPLSPTCLLTLVEREWAEQNLGKRVWLDGSLLGRLKPKNVEYQRSLQVSGSYRFVYCPLPDFGLAGEMCNNDPSLTRPPENQVVINYRGRTL
jgi:uncharacterized protein DUF4238